MLGLHDLQAGFANALLGGPSTPVGATILEDGLPIDVRLAIYRNNVLASLTEVLRETFPVVCRLVDDRFFGYAADAFIRAHPPNQACLSAYGAQLPDFLASFPPCRGLPYLGDVARLEWLMHAAAHAADAVPVSTTALHGVPASESPRLTFALHPSFGLLASPWPVDRIWRANQPGADPATTIDLDAPGVHLDVERHADDVTFRVLDRPTYEFRAAVARGDRIEAAADAAFAVDPAFDLGTAISDLFLEGIVVGARVAPLLEPEA
jgi:hypothetical protein